MTKNRNAFPLPSEIQDIPGAEDWAELYPYYTRFRPEDDQRFWFYNSMHFPEPMPAFDAISAEVPYTGLGAFTTRIFVFPTTLGVDHRIVNGRVYITASPVTDPAEIGRRLGIFQERAGHYYENWTTLYGQWEQRLKGLIAEIDGIKVPELPEFDDEEVVFEARGIGQNHYVREAYHRTIECYSKMWHHHFEFLMLGYGAYVVFFQFCKKAFPEIPDQSVARMVGGIDVLMFRPDDELKRLARAALTNGVDDCFADGIAAADIIEAMAKRGKPGELWLAELEKSRDPWFNVSTGDGFYHHHRCWNDDLAIPFSAITRYIGQIKEGKNLDRPTERLKLERAAIIAEYRELLTSDAERATFDQMLGLCHVVFPYVEDHKFYCEHWFTTRFYSKLREFGALLVKNDALSDVEDVFQLQHSEVDQALIDLMLSWAGGSAPAGGHHWKPIVKRRKELLKRLADWSAPAALGPIPEHIGDPALQMLWGVTSETLQAWSQVPEGDDEKVVRGFAASPGVVEGVARVLHTVSQIGELQEGEILVCPVTLPSWGPVFGKIKAAVSDIGGTMSHAAIVAREYGMPAVVGTGSATKRIRTGQRLRVDGGTGTVTLLD